MKGQGGKEHHTNLPVAPQLQEHESMGREMEVAPTQGCLNGHPWAFTSATGARTKGRGVKGEPSLS